MGPIHVCLLISFMYVTPFPSSDGDEEHSNYIRIRGDSLDSKEGLRSVPVDGNPHSHVSLNSIDGGLDLEERPSLIERAALLDGEYSSEDQDEFPPLEHPDGHASVSWLGPKGLLASCQVRSLFCLELLVLVSVTNPCVEERDCDSDRCYQDFRSIILIGALNESDRWEFSKA